MRVTKRRRKKVEARWHRKPSEPGFYVSFQRGRGFDVFFWPGFDDPAFEIRLSDKTIYFGPFKIPLSV
jgi:hypothetical protein